MSTSNKQARRKSKTIAEDEAETRAITQSAQSQYGRGEKVRTKSVKDVKLRANLKTLERKNQQAALQAKQAEVLLDNNAGLLEPENELERTYRVRQDDIKKEVSMETAKKGFDLRLEGMGPYMCEYSRNGRNLLLGSTKGHVASFDWRDGKLNSETQLNETVRDVSWLHVSNEHHYAVAQKRFVYIYSGDGVELHQLKNHVEATHLEYLPYHFLLTSISTTGIIRYTDVSTGKSLEELYTKMGTPTAFCQNPHNAILHAGHQKGLVSLWSPNSATPLVKLLPHKGPVRGLAVDRSGRYMVSTSQDCRMSVWDIRMFKEVHSQRTRLPGNTVAISDRGLTAIGAGSHVSIYRPELFTQAPDSTNTAPYLNWGGDGHAVSRVKFCPFEDVLGISHDKGFSSIIVPGAGEPNYDSLEPGTNPFETNKQRRETEVRAVLEKIQPGMISLNPDFVGKLDTVSDAQRKKERDLDAKAEDKSQKFKKKARGKNSALRKYQRKHGSSNIIDEEKERAREAMKSMEKREIEKMEKQKVKYGPALERFARKGF